MSRNIINFSLFIALLLALSAAGIWLFLELLRVPDKGNTCYFGFNIHTNTQITDYCKTFRQDACGVSLTDCKSPIEFQCLTDVGIGKLQGPVCEFTKRGNL